MTDGQAGSEPARGDEALSPWLVLRRADEAPPRLAGGGGSGSGRMGVARGWMRRPTTSPPTRVSLGSSGAHHDAPQDRTADGTSGQDARGQNACTHCAVAAEQREGHSRQDTRDASRRDVDVDCRYDEKQHCRRRQAAWHEGTQGRQEGARCVEDGGA